VRISAEKGRRRGRGGGIREKAEERGMKESAERERESKRARREAYLTAVEAGLKSGCYVRTSRES
jgi:hypothetical protein